jgi:acetyl-CoA synthetase
MLRGLYKADDKYRETYWSKYNNKFYFTSDGARKIAEDIRLLGKVEDFIRVTGRVDDVMKVAGHRLATAELEDALDRHHAVSESAVVPKPHEIKGEVPVAYVVLKKGIKSSDELANELVSYVGKTVGPIAKPDRIIFADELPKTRSGKIMRRVLKALLINEPVGDVTTLLNPECVDDLKRKVGYYGGPA